MSFRKPKKELNLLYSDQHKKIWEQYIIIQVFVRNSWAVFHYITRISDNEALNKIEPTAYLISVLCLLFKPQTVFLWVTCLHLTVWAVNTGVTHNCFRPKLYLIFVLFRMNVPSMLWRYSTWRDPTCWPCIFDTGRSPVG